jgi:urease accessory protein
VGRISAAFLVVLLTPGLVLAHTGSGADGFLAGLTHPVLGFDHFLAMLSVGILSAQIGGRAIWIVPTTFVAVMAIGAAIGLEKIALPGVEYGIALSVLILGFALALDKKLPPVWAMFGVAFFAMFHGHAHGTEMPTMVQPMIYAGGFLLGTAAIHVAGVLIGIFSERSATGAAILRYVGAGISGVGFHIIFILTKYR